MEIRLPSSVDLTAKDREEMAEMDKILNVPFTFSKHCNGSKSCDCWRCRGLKRPNVRDWECLECAKRDDATANDTCPICGHESPMALLTPEQADAAYEAAIPEPLSEERINEIVKFATSEPHLPPKYTAAQVAADMEAKREAFDRYGLTGEHQMASLAEGYLCVICGEEAPKGTQCSGPPQITHSAKIAEARAAFGMIMKPPPDNPPQPDPQPDTDEFEMPFPLPPGPK